MEEYTRLADIIYSRGMGNISEEEILGFATYKEGKSWKDCISAVVKQEIQQQQLKE